MSALNGWHPGEKIVQQKLGFADKVALAYTGVHADLPPQHAEFYETCLPFIPVTTLDESGRPWGCILAGKGGMKKGFARSVNYQQLNVKAQSWVGDPLIENLRYGLRKEGKALFAGIGVEFETRRRNKLAGFVSKLECSDYDVEMELVVNEAYGNCPKYINVRNLEPTANPKPRVEYDHSSLSMEDRLPDDVIDFIHSRDTVFLGSSYVSSPETAERFPSHLGMNHRGGLAGFIRVRKDGRTLVLPDYSGNRLMSSLGNIESTPLASLTFVDFSTGDILYLTGTAKNLIGQEAHEIMPFQNALTSVHTTGYIFVRDALPVRQTQGTVHNPSPYSPPVRLLAEETSINLFNNDDRPDALLTSVTIHSSQVITLSWESSKELNILPGQAIVLDCSSLLGARQYQHMSPLNPNSVNDDYIRTWTVSSSSSASGGPTKRFTITLRHKVGGALTTAFFTIAQKLEQTQKVELLRDARPLNLTLKIAGITGEFTLPPLSPTFGTSTTTRRLVWFAGGIGVTPFLSMLDSLRIGIQENPGEQVDIRLVLSARDAKTLLPLVYEKYTGTNPPVTIDASVKNNNTLNQSNLRLVIDVFQGGTYPANEMELSSIPVGVVCQQFLKRLDTTYIEEEMKEDFVGRDVYICGPDEYMRMVLEVLDGIGVEPGRIHSEGFTY